MTLVAGKISWAEYAPLGPETEPIIKPRVLIFHTMVGNLHVVDRMFRVGGYDGTESTFGVGGRWSSEDIDGELIQWQLTGRQADAQFGGNDYADSVETSDGGNPHNPWTSPQLKTLIHLTVDWCQGLGKPARLVASEADKGLGYHEQFRSWNTDGHTCPGPVREGQLRQIIIPKARTILSGKTPTPVHVDPNKDVVQVDGVFGHGTIVATQVALGFRGGAVDGIFGPDTRRALQHRVGAAQDANIGPITVRHWKAYLKSKGYWPWVNATIDGAWSHVLTVQHQKALNAHKF
jgi:hypothetical protein